MESSVSIVIWAGHETRLLLLGNTVFPPYYLHVHRRRQQELAMGVFTPLLSLVQVVLECHSDFMETLMIDGY